MRVLITGGTCVISTAITGLLLERRDDVALCNRGITQALFPGNPRLIRGVRLHH